MYREVKKLVQITLVFISLFISNLYAWQDTGHMVVAEIAYRHLDPEIVSKVEYLISKSATDYPKNATFVTASVWPDDIKGHKINFFNDWHYEDKHYSTDGSLVEKNNGQIVKMLKKTRELIASDATIDAEKSFALKFFIHLTGDIHQPLHTISRFSKETPSGDRGGNLFKLKGKSKNLHSLWDSALNSLPRVHRPLDSEGTLMLNNLADDITTKYPKDSFTNAELAANFADWHHEGYTIAVNRVYKEITFNSLPSTHYINDNLGVAHQQLSLAGYRLANQLNCLYKSSSCIISE